MFTNPHLEQSRYRNMSRIAAVFSKIRSDKFVFKICFMIYQVFHIFLCLQIYNFTLHAGSAASEFLATNRSAFDVRNTEEKHEFNVQSVFY
jgi:hypothetical protein